jgi:uncharacterized membrane protein YgdD (TMEM256/DUF423 family)
MQELLVAEIDSQASFFTLHQTLTVLVVAVHCLKAAKHCNRCSPLVRAALYCGSLVATALVIVCIPLSYLSASLQHVSGGVQ